MRLPHRILKRPNAFGDMEFICQFQLWFWFECQVFDKECLTFTWSPAIYVSEDGAAEYLLQHKQIKHYNVVTEGQNLHFGTIGTCFVAVLMSTLLWWANT